MKIAFLHPDLGIGGAERLIVDAAVGLQSKGHSVVIYTSHHDRSHCFPETIDGTLSVRVGGDFLPKTCFQRGYILFAILRNLYLTLIILASRILGTYYDVIIVDQLSASIPLLRFSGSKILFYCHFPDKLLSKKESFVKSLYRIPIDYLEEITTKMSDGILVNSKFTQTVFKESFTSIKTLPDVLYPAIHTSHYDKIIDETNPLVTKLKSSRKRILSINRFERKKNIKLAIQAFALLLEKKPDYRATLQLVIAGGYDASVRENKEYLEELCQLAQNLNIKFDIFSKEPIKRDEPLLESPLLFLPSFTDDQRTMLLKSAQCLVYTPSFEHFGIVPLEAMYSGLPVIAVNNGGPTESILDKSTGYLCESDPEAFSQAILDVLRPNQKKLLGECGRRRVLDHFSLESFASTLDARLKRLVRETSWEARATWYTACLVLVGLLVFSVALRV